VITVEDLLAPMANGPDLRLGKCVGRWQLWDDVSDPATVEFATGQCLSCPVLAKCREWSSTLGDKQISGIVAGAVRIHPSDRKQRVSA
jgi:hypothetical protein